MNRIIHEKMSILTADTPPPTITYLKDFSAIDVLRLRDIKAKQTENNLISDETDKRVKKL